MGFFFVFLYHAYYIPKNGEEKALNVQEKGIVGVVGWQYFCTME